MNNVNIRDVTALDRPPYHHGDLKNALVAQATDLARAGGPDSVVLREAARRVGVSPSAAYRHFPSLDALLAAVASRAREAIGRSMLERIAEVPPDEDARHAALARFRATGVAYIDFALREPGLFRVAFVSCDPAVAVFDDPSPYAILSEAIDAVAATGGMDPARRPHAEEVAWSAVHGVAVLIGEGIMPLADAREQADVIDRVLDAVAEGLGGD